MFFKPVVDLLDRSGHQVLCTSRDYREVVELAKIKKLGVKVVGRHGGSDRYDKLVESGKRVVKLAETVKAFNPNVAVTFSSPEGARVAFGLGIKHIGFNDSPHAEAVARLTVPLMNKLLCPWVIPTYSWTRFGISRDRIIKYRALDPVVWIKRMKDPASSSKHDISFLDAAMGKNPASIDRDKRTILIRMEESKASYITDKKLENPETMIDGFVKHFSKLANIIILCRYKDQVVRVANKYRGIAHVPRNVVDSIPLISFIDIFVGAGGTMTAESALVGKPTISIAPLKFHVEKYLINVGLVERVQDAKSLTRLVEKILDSNKYYGRQKSRARRILDSMEDPVEKIVPLIEDSVRL